VSSALHPPAGDESVLDSAIALLDDLLAAGVGPDALDLSALPDGLRAGLTDRLSCLLKLRACASPTPDTPVPDSASGDGPAAAESGVTGQFGRFTIRRELGRGGYGIVYLAHDPRLGREVALKVPRREVFLDPAGRDRIRHEARAAALLDHPNIVPVFESGSVGPVWYVVSAYCPGVSLAEWLAGRDSPVPPREAAQLIAAVADAVQHAHSRGILHRDLKPSNILMSGVRDQESGVRTEPPSSLTPDPCLLTPKVTDFGLAKILAGDDGAATRSGAVVGTPQYMAPEQAEGRVKDITAMTDVWALGVILYELLTGEPPFRADDHLQVLRRVSADAPTPPRARRPDVPRDLESVCLKCLEKDPHRRYPTAAELADDLRRYLAGEPIRARRPPLLERGRRWVARHPLKALVAALAVLLPTAAALGVGWHNRKLSAALDATERSEAEAGRRGAEAEAHRQSLAEAVNGVIVTMDEFVRDLPQTEVGRRQVLERAKKLSEGLQKVEANNPGLRRPIARVHLSRAEIAMMVGDFNAAAEALDLAEPGIREWAAESSDDPEPQGKLVNLVRGRWYVADQQKDPQRTRPHALEVEERTTDLAARFPDHLYFQNWRAHALAAVANLDAAAEPPPESSGTRLREALKIFRGLEPKVRKDNPEIRFERAATQMNYADYLRAARKPSDAVAAYQEVVALLSDDEWYPNPRPHHLHHKAAALRRWGGVLFELGEPERAAEQLTQAADILRSLAASGQPGDYAAFRLEPLAERAIARWAAGRHDDARADAEEVVRKFPAKGRRVWRAKALWVLGESARLKKDFARAREQLHEVLAADDSKADRTETREWLHIRALAHVSLGETAGAESDRPAAARHYKSAHELLTRLTEAHPELPRYGRVREVVDKHLRDASE
jgi:tetratricopeptide (TPR) repeat protein